MALPIKMYSLKGVVQHYSWGGYDYIPNLLGISNIDQKPFAEYWLGAHPNHPSQLLDSSSQLLDAFIAADPKEVMGKDVAKKFSSLPYLLKVLDVRQMLSIQVHPSKQSAIKGFEEENKKGIPVTAPVRNYKDQNHKPELMVSLGDFWLLHGFKKEEDLKKVLANVSELNFLRQVFELEGYKGLYQKVMLMEQEEVNKVLSPLLDRIVPLYQNGKFQKDQEDFWAARAAVTFCKTGDYDRGIFSIYFFNLLYLKKGEGIYQPAGMPHAYLEGQNVEIMANSDNVLRAGLTDKYIDVAELLKHVHFEPTIPNVLHSSASGYSVFSTPAEEFELHGYQLNNEDEEAINTQAPEIWLLIDGAIKAQQDGQTLYFKKGEAVFLPAQTSVILEANAKTTLFRASVPN
jgi:mannose-6-phosphate isomerase